MKKIEYAVGAAELFIHHLHREGFDRGMIATFGNTFRVEQGFTGTEAYLHSALARVSRSVSNEGTRLYSSMEDVIRTFWDTGDRRRPWLLTIITDGKDYDDSGKYRNNPAGIGRYVAEHYNHQSSNYIFMIGVGKGQDIDERALATLGDTGGFLAMRIGAFPLLEMAFLQIAVDVTTRLEGRRISVGNLTWQEVAQIRQVSQIPFDYAFLIDRSGSMNDAG